jgi:Anti-sigma-K factor rskA, C-terminal/Putative zinc-finger
MGRRVLTHEEVLDELPGYLLGDADPRTATALEVHLSGCPCCQEELDRQAEVLGRLGTLAAPATPPAELRERVLARLDEPAELQPSFRQPIRPARWLRPLLVAAAVVILVLGDSVAYLYRNLDQARSELAAGRSRDAEARWILAEPSATIPLVAGNGVGAYGTLFLAPGGTQAVMVIDKLPPAPAGRLYQVWLVQDGRRTSAALFTAAQGNGAQLLLSAPQPLRSYQSLGITLEPAPRGSSGPTTPKVIGCPLGNTT